MCLEWNISSENVTAVVTDNGRNIVKAVTDVFSENKSFPCFAHTLNLVEVSLLVNNCINVDFKSVPVLQNISFAYLCLKKIEY